jgi:hypothetical protein
MFRVVIADAGRDTDDPDYSVQASETVILRVRSMHRRCPCCRADEHLMLGVDAFDKAVNERWRGRLLK